MRWIILSSLGLIFLHGCSSPPLKPIPADERYPLVVRPIEDLTGEYQRNFMPFEELLSRVLLDDFIGIRKPQRDQGEVSSLEIYPNPFRVLSSTDSGANAILITGEVERIAYERFVDVKGGVATFEFLGLLGLMMNGDDSVMSGYVQYRFHVFNSHGTPLENFVVIGVSRGNVEKTGRQQLLLSANRKALYMFSARLLQLLNSRLNWNLPVDRSEGTSKRMNSIRNLRLLLD